MDTRQLREHFNRHADDFDRLYDPGRQSLLSRWLNRHFRTDIANRYLAALDHVRSSGAKSVLDVGCGPGHYLVALAEMGIPRALGIDASEEMISLARQQPALVGRSSVEIVHADYTEWQTDEKFDIVLAIGFFDYTNFPGLLLKKMRMHADHSVFASFPSRHWLRTPFRWTRRRFQGTKVYFYSEADISRLGQEAGFVSTEITKLPGAGMNRVAVFRVT
jgi:2-polyprenyl-3-methyl-5-hydroxy-6-metoxy-1,4-benzoquinol methylase